jgi:hypothetical protein
LAPLWLKGLPFKADEKEAKIAHLQLAEAVQKGDMTVIGKEFENVTDIIRIAADIFLSCEKDAETGTRIFASPIAHYETLQNLQQSMKTLASGKPTRYFLCF